MMAIKDLPTHHLSHDSEGIQIYLKTTVFRVYKGSAPPLSLSHCSLKWPVIYAYVNIFPYYMRNFQLKQFLQIH